jgi:UDP-2,4-diacetamido-2,4,6-trideoxy-beta-L-altropyranose hydrolase
MVFNGEKKIKQIVFRVDSSAQIGSGHLMRCLTLANQLRDRAKILFVCRDLEHNLSSLVKKNGFDLILLPREDEDETLVGYEKWLAVKQKIDAEQTKEVIKNCDIKYMVIDNYAIDEEWENIVRPYVKKIMVIDDLANRRHNCDILLDQNYYCDMKTRYNKLVPTGCKLLLGPQYALLREEFYKTRQKMRVRDGTIKNILVFFGGSDLTNETIKTLHAIEEVNRIDITINVVVGASNKNKHDIENFCNKYENMHYFCQVNNMAELLHKADLAIGAGGTTTWERCFLGLPAIVIAIAENQVQISKDCAKLGIIEYVGEAAAIDIAQLSDAIIKMIQNKKYIKNMIKKADRVAGGLSVNKAVSDILG